MAPKLRFKQQLQLWMFFLMISNCSLTSSTTGDDEEIVTEIVFSVSSSHDPVTNRTAKLPLKRRSSTEIPQPQLAPAGITAEPQHLDPQVTDSIEFKRDSDTQNETREALALEGSQRDSVVFVSDSAGYVPVSAIRPRKSGVGGLNNAGLPRADSTGAPVTGLETEVEPGQDLGTGLSGAASDLIDWHIHHDTWDREYRRYRFNNTRVQHIEAECQDDYMKIRIGFNGTFTGLVYSAGYAYDPDCMYINGTGRDYYEFYIQLNRCGTLGKNTHHEDNRKNPTKNFMWNTVTVQYNPLIEEEFDEHFKVTCEYGYDFWKTVTFPFLDVEVATGNPVVFTLTPPECYMEIRYGYGTSGSRVGGPVRVGDPLTLIIYMRSKYDGFDIVVNDCYAHNGATKKIQLIDEYGCPVDDKLISRFRGSWSDSGVFETQVFAYMKTFRFTGSPALYIECDVRMCHGRCPTQPCHWRNTKNIQKRSLSSEGPSLLSAALTASTTKSPSLSENINLFQSLRVLQEGEGEEDGAFSSERLQSQTADPGSVCMKTGWFGAMLTLGAATLCALGGASFAMYMRLHRHKQLSSGSQVGSVAFDGYMTHKGRIN